WYRAEVQVIRTANAVSDIIYPGQKLLIPDAQSGQAAVTASVSSSAFSAADVDLLARLVQAEATGEPYTGKVSVAAVVLNRVRSPNFPNSISGVIYQPMQFCPVQNGTINRPAGAEASGAARDAINGWDPTGGALYFFNPAKTTNSFIWSRPVIITIGNHHFTR
ncbi:MAG: cell wall hydrolase, partial [Bacillota bacterium]